MEMLEALSQRSWMSPAAKERVELATTKYQDGIQDARPMLIQAELLTEDELQLFVYDETGDLLGIVIEERTRDPNGSVHVQEQEYPVFAHFSVPGIASCQLLRIQIPKEAQSKDETLWRDYVNMDFDVLAEQAYGQWPGRHSSEGPWDDPQWQHRCEFYDETLPAVWVPIPEPNGVDVTVRVYDKQGHRSNPARLLDRR